MTTQAAMRHEKSIGHTAKVEARNAWDVRVDVDAWGDSTQPRHASKNATSSAPSITR